ncbi:MAG TPA: DoxX family protein [Myxococcales bacterium]|nr:DoxX family protein [Myxococcales bacterium]
MTSKKLSVLYWGATVFAALIMGFAGVLFLLRVQAAVTVLDHLRYPLYFANLIGVTRLLGAAAVLLPVPKGLREWAYAGLTFDLLITIFSIPSSGLPLLAIMQPLIILVAVLGSYLCWRKRSSSGGYDVRPRCA